MADTPSAAPEGALVLIADDDDIQRLLLRQALEVGGFSVEEAENGAEAVAAMQRVQPDVVLLDVCMPEMDGFAACEAVRRLPGGESISPFTAVMPLKSSCCCSHGPTIPHPFRSYPWRRG